MHELMLELGLLDSSVGGETISYHQLLDQLKMFQSERNIDTRRCRELFDRHDADGSGFLDKDEVRRLAEHMGFGPQMATDATLLDTLMADIDKTRTGAGRAAPAAETAVDQASDEQVTYQELLGWFLEIGTSSVCAPAPRPPPMCRPFWGLGLPCATCLFLLTALSEPVHRARSELPVAAHVPRASTPGSPQRVAAAAAVREDGHRALRCAERG
jgi:hypothetical protein